MYSPGELSQRIRDEDIELLMDLARLIRGSLPILGAETAWKLERISKNLAVVKEGLDRNLTKHLEKLREGKRNAGE